MNNDQWWRTVRQIRTLDSAACAKRCKFQDATHKTAGRISFKWESVFTRAFGVEWQALVNAGNWKARQHDRLQSAFAFVQRRRDCDRFRARGHRKRKREPNFEQPRVLPPYKLHWQQSFGPARVWIGVDNELVSQWMNGETEIKYNPYKRLASSLVSTLNSLYTKNYIAPYTDHGNFVYHVYRERNKHADEPTKRAAKGEMGCPELPATCWTHDAHQYMRLQTDGSAYAEKSCFTIGGAFWQSERKPNAEISKHDWTHVLDFGCRVNAKSTMETELLALVRGIVYLTFRLLPGRVQMTLPDVTSMENSIKLA